MDSQANSHFPGKKKASILVVEDDFPQAALIGEILSCQTGWHIQIADSLESAINFIAKQLWDLLIIDLNLPDSHGLETFLRLRKEAPDSGIVIISAESEESLIQATLRAGSQDYVIKGSLAPPVIVQTIKNALERSRLGLSTQDSRELLASTLDTLPNYIAIMEEDGRIRATNLRWINYGNQDNPLIYGCVEGSNYLAACDLARGDASGLSSAAIGILRVIIGTSDRFCEDYCVPAFTGSSWYELNATRFTDKKGTPVVVISHTDISDRKELEAKLRVSEELFSIISNNLVDLMAIIDSKGYQTFTSPSYRTVLGYTREELDKLTFFQLIHPEDIEKTAIALDALFTGQSTIDVNYRIQHKMGHYLYLESRGSHIPTSNLGRDTALMLGRDVSGRHLAEQEKLQMEIQLRQAQKLEAIGQLAAGIAHEINTPTQYIGDNTIFLKEAIQDLCSVINLVIESLAKPITSASMERILQELARIDIDYLQQEMPRAISQSLEGVARVSRIVNAMKDFSHPSGNKKEFIDLNQAIERTTIISLNEWKYFAEMELNLDPALPLVPCFPGELNQVILNLIVNAAHAIDESKGENKNNNLGKISISTRQLDNFIEIQISDNGTGIPEAIRNRVFDLFFTTKPVGKGTGQGLSLAHGVIVEKHNGQLYFDSEVGKGTTFFIKLPLGEDASNTGDPGGN